VATQPGSIKEWFDTAPSRFPSSVAWNVDAVIQMDITGAGGGQWYLTLKDKKLALAEGQHEKPSATVTVSADDWLRVINRTANAESLYMMGKIRITGSMYLVEGLAGMLGFV